MCTNGSYFFLSRIESFTLKPSKTNSDTLAGLSVKGRSEQQTNRLAANDTVEDVLSSY